MTDTLTNELSDRPSENKTRITTQFYFDSARHALIGSDDSIVYLRPQSLEVLLLLLRNANEVVTKQVILDSVWKNINVTDDSVTQCIADIRRALGQENRALLQTVPKVGYRLCLGVDNGGNPIIASLCPPPSTESNDQNTRLTEAVDSANANAYANTGRNENPHRRDSSKLFGNSKTLLGVGISLLLLLGIFAYTGLRNDPQPIQGSLAAQGPVIAVLPFKSVGMENDNPYFSDGLTEDLIAMLSRFSELGLVSWRAVANIQEEEKNISLIAQEFNVRYLVSGTVRHNNDRVRVSVQLTDTTDGKLLWADRYDEQLQDIFKVQDEISRQVAATLAVKLTDIETEISKNIQTENFTAYQMALLGRYELRKRSREGTLAARKYFVSAIESDVGYADAYIRLGQTYLEEALFGWTEWPEQSREKAMKLGLAAMKVGGTNASTLGFMAMVQVRMEEFAKAQTYLDRAFEFNSNDPLLHEIQGLLYLWSGEAAEAIEHLDYVLRFDPASTTALSHLATAYYIVSRPADALATIERMIEISPDVHYIHIILTASLIETGDVNAAKQSVKMVQRQHPFLKAESTGNMGFFHTPDVRQRIVDSLKRAGLN